MNSSGVQRTPAMVGVETVDQALGAIDEAAWLIEASAEIGPVGRVQVLDHVDAILGNLWVEVLERRPDVLHAVTAVVEHDVRQDRTRR